MSCITRFHFWIVSIFEYSKNAINIVSHYAWVSEANDTRLDSTVPSNARVLRRKIGMFSRASMGKIVPVLEIPDSQNLAYQLQRNLHMRIMSHIMPIVLDQIHNLQVPSAPALTHHGSLGCQSISNTPSSLFTLCPFNTFRGTIVAFSIKSATTLP